MSEKRLPFHDVNGLAIRLREVRKATGKNMVEIAVDLGVRQSSVSNWEIGTVEPPLEYLFYAVNKLGAPSVDWLLTGWEPGAREEDSEVADLLAQARKVLKSGKPPYTGLLRQSIKSFFEALQQEEAAKEPTEKKRRSA